MDLTADKLSDPGMFRNSLFGWTWWCSYANNIPSSTIGNCIRSKFDKQRPFTYSQWGEPAW